MSVCLGDFFGSYLYSRAKSNEIKFEKGTWAERKIPNPSPIVFWFDLDSAFARLYLLLNKRKNNPSLPPPPPPPKKKPPATQAKLIDWGLTVTYVLAVLGGAH